MTNGSSIFYWNLINIRKIRSQIWMNLLNIRVQCRWHIFPVVGSYYLQKNNVLTIIHVPLTLNAKVHNVVDCQAINPEDINDIVYETVYINISLFFFSGQSLISLIFKIFDKQLISCLTKQYQKFISPVTHKTVQLQLSWHSLPGHKKLSASGTLLMSQQY